MLEPSQAMANKNAVLVVQRHAVRHGAERDEGDAVDEEIAELFGDLGSAAAGPLAKRPRQLERNTRAAQMPERIGATRQARSR